MNVGTGNVALDVIPCIYIPGEPSPTGTGLRVTLAFSLKTNLGNVAVFEDTTPLINCDDGTLTAGPLTLTPLASNHNEDSAESLAVLGLPDPCTDYRELGGAANTGGLRDPFNPYDFYDVTGDGAVNADDITAVASHFLQTSESPGYEPKFDRGPVIGPNTWNVEGPNGSITADDLTVLGAQFLHVC